MALACLLSTKAVAFLPGFSLTSLVLEHRKSVSFIFLPFFGASSCHPLKPINSKEMAPATLHCYCSWLTLCFLSSRVLRMIQENHSEIL